MTVTDNREGLNESGAYIFLTCEWVRERERREREIKYVKCRWEPPKFIILQFKRIENITCVNK